MSSKPLVAVVGSTGNQGISVVKTLLATGKYRVRGLTRNVESGTSKALAAQGAEMVKANLNNHDELKHAFKGANIVFAVTNFWDPEIVGGDQTLEVRQGKLIADVAKEVGVEWIFWSSLADTKAGSNGELTHVLHFDGKNEVEQYIRKLGIPATFVYVAFYMTNFEGFFPKIENADGSVEIAMPYVTEDTVIPLVYPPKDVGPIVAAILEDRESWRGKAVPIAGEEITLREAFQIISEHSGVRTTLRPVDDKNIKDFPSLNNAEMIDMCKWYGYGYFGKGEVADVSVSKKLHPKITTFREFCAEKYGKK